MSRYSAVVESEEIPTLAALTETVREINAVERRIRKVKRRINKVLAEMQLEPLK